MKKALSVLVSVLLVLSVLVGCSGNLGRKDRTPETTAASTPPTAPSEETGITNEDFQTILANGNTQFVAELLLQDAVLSGAYSLTVKVENGSLYLNDVLYDQIAYVEDYSVRYSAGLLASAEALGNTATDICRTLENQRSYFLLTSQSSTKYGHRVALCFLEGACYILCVSEAGEVTRIHLGAPQAGN